MKDLYTMMKKFQMKIGKYFAKLDNLMKEYLQIRKKIGQLEKRLNRVLKAAKSKRRRGGAHRGAMVAAYNQATDIPIFSSATGITGKVLNKNISGIVSGK